MRQVTNLKEVAHPTVPGREIAVHVFKVDNFRLHAALQMLSRLILAMVESQTNNQKGEIVPRDVSAVRTGWEAFKTAFKFALDHNDPPSAAHEFGYKISLPSGIEIQKVPNIKTKMIIMDLNHLAEIIMSSDSANSSANIAPQSQADIETQIGIAEDCMDLWYGKGKDNSDVGQAVPIFKHLGTLVPDLDSDFREVREPSADAPDTGRPDVIDRPIGD